MSKLLKNRSLRLRLLISIIFIIFLQTFICGAVVIFSGTPQRLDESSIQILSNTVSTRGAAFEQQMASYTNILDFETQITAAISKQAETKNMSIAEYVQAEENRSYILQNANQLVLNALRESGATACFIILENEQGNTEKDTLYLRDLNPLDNPDNNCDILVEAGSSDLLFHQGFTLDSFWSQKLEIADDCDFYHVPFDAGNAYPDIDALDLGYFSLPSRLHPSDVERISYSIPLLDENHRSYGVIGFGMTLDYLKKLIPSREISLDSYGSYVLGMTTDYEHIYSIVAENSLYRTDFSSGDTIVMSSTNEKHNLYRLTTNSNKDKLSACIYPLHLYNNNSPFEDQHWILFGVVGDSTLYAASSRLKLILLISLAGSVLISLLGSLIITHYFMTPILTLLQGIPKLMPGYGTLPKTSIEEFDALADAIIKQNVTIYKAGHRMADIIDLAGIPLGVIEYSSSSENIYCTHKIFDILQVDDSLWNNNYINKQILTKRLLPYTQLFTKIHNETDTYLYRCPDSNDKWINIKQVGNSGNTLYVLMDVTESMHEKQKIIHDRDYDVLTNLYNRRAFAREIEYLIDQGNCVNGILSIWDLDNLKYTNDTYGHDIGDKYICMLANVLKQDLHVKSLAARLSGDEFTLFVYDSPMPELQEIVRKLHASLMRQKLYLPDGNTLNVSASAGTALYSQDAITYADLLKYADFAMYQVKKSSKGNIKAFDKESYVKDYILVQGVGELDRIVSEKAIRYAFQPIISLNDNSIFAYEALIRPVSDLLGRPDNLLRVAKNQSKMGQIERITWFHALEDFFKQVRDNDSAKVFVNSIPDQILSEGELSELEQLYGDNLSRVVMEITESSKIDTVINQRKRDFCRKWNICIALDDYGAGYSNSDMLVTQSFDYIKLDMTLIRNIHLSPSTQTLVRSMIHYCHDNQVKVIAEGIETIDEYSIVKNMGADYGQGFYFVKPRFDLY